MKKFLIYTVCFSALIIGINTAIDAFFKYKYSVYNLDFYKNKDVVFKLYKQETNGISDEWIKENTAVIIRSAGERTEKACFKILADVFGRDNVILIKNAVPFRSAAELCFRAGILKNKKWTLIVDSDVIFIKDRLIRYLKYSELLSRKKENVYSIKPYLISKFRKFPHSYGVSLYRTKYLEKALEYFSGVKGLQLEYQTALKVSENDNLENFNIMYYTGLGDFFQSYNDILRKSVIYCSKWKDLNEKIKFWEQNSFFDFDFKYALSGCNIKQEAEKPLYDEYGSIDSIFLNNYIRSLEADKKIKIGRRRVLTLNYINKTLKYFKRPEPDFVYVEKDF